MKRKIIANSLIALLLFPALLFYRRFVQLFTGNYRNYDTVYDTPLEYIKHAIFHPMAYPFVPILFLLFILLPFQFIKDTYQKKGQKFSFLKKTGLLTVIICALVIFIGTFSNIWKIPWYENFMYIVYITGFSLITETVLYFTVDIYNER